MPMSNRPVMWRESLDSRDAGREDRREASPRARGPRRPAPPGRLPVALSALTLAVGLSSCRAAAPDATARNLVLVTIDTLRADRVGSYGWARARTPVLDGLARRGALFERAYAAAPITLPSHATMLTGRYPPGHGVRDNGMPMSASSPTLATSLSAHGFKTAAFVSAFPLDRQFGLNRGFDVYGDRLPTLPDGRPINERPGADVIDEAIAWLQRIGALGSASPRFFLWVHLFEPHAPYGHTAGASRPVLERYDDEIATADRQMGRLLEALGPRLADTLVVATSDHGEAFGEHGEYAHSIFVYDTTLRVPLIVAGPGIPRGTRIADSVTLADLAPTAMRALGATIGDVDGLDLGPAFAGTPLGRRELYAESFAPLVEFGWAPLRTIRSGHWKYIAAPRPELYDVEKDAQELTNAVTAQATVARELDARAGRYSGASLPPGAGLLDPLAAERLRALGYSAGSGQPDRARPDPKDRRELAARIAQVTSGELTGAALISALERIVRDDPRNGQAHLRLAYARYEMNDCARAEPEFHATIAAGLPSVDAQLGLATCLGRRGDLVGAERALGEARRLAPESAVIAANMGILKAAKGDLAGAIETLTNALAAQPDLHEARFNLAVAYAKGGRRADAVATARDLLTRLSPDAPQRAEVERLLRQVQ